MSHVGTTYIADTGYAPYWDDRNHKFQTQHKPGATPSKHYGSPVALDNYSPEPHYYSRLRPKPKRTTGHWLYG
jgi:hypothetical protein